MRKITALASHALLHGDSFKRDNTRVTHAGNKAQLYLHGHKVAEHSLSGTLELNDCGWRTPTTKERLNGVLDAFNTGLYIYQKQHVWYIHNQETDTTTEWEDGVNVINL